VGFIDAMAEAHKTERVVSVLGSFDDGWNRSHAAHVMDFLQHF
jgi:hypothetical protein